MPAGFINLNRSAAVAAAAIFLAAGVAVADTSEIPNLDMSVTTNGSTIAFNPADYGNAWGNANDTFGFAGNLNGGSFGLGWSMLADSTFVIANYVVTNNTLVDQDFTITVSVPVGAVSGPFNLIGGSVTGSITDLNGDGATLSSPVGGSLYEALADGNTVATLLDDPFTVSSGNYESATVGPASFGEPIPGQLFAGPINASIAITLSFTLSAGDAAAFTSIFVIEKTIPTPAGLALLGLAGVIGSRRRRA